MGEIIDKVKGKMKQVEGDLNGDSVRHAEGVADELKGKAKGVVEDIKHAVREAVKK